MAKKKKSAARKPASERGKAAKKAVEAVKREKALRDAEDIRLLRRTLGGHTAAEGYSVKPAEIEKLSRGRRSHLRAKAKQVRRLLETPHTKVVKPKTKQEAKALRKFTGERFRGQKQFIVHTMDDKTKVSVEAGQVQLSIPVPGKAEYQERFYFFPTRPRSVDEMLAMLRKMLPTMPDKGRYIMWTDTYGASGTIVDKGQLLPQLRGYLYKYDVKRDAEKKYGRHRFLNRVLGFRWSMTERTVKEVKAERKAARRARRKRR